MRKLLFFFLIISMAACKYSFKGTSIDPEANSFYVDVFDIKSPNTPPTIGQTFTNELINKIRSETRLDFSENNPDYEFSGSISNYTVTSVAPQAGETTALNRLNITVNVEMLNNLDEEKNWKNRFPYFFDFSSTTNLLDVQEEAIESINEQLIEDIFKKAFTDW